MLQVNCAHENKGYLEVLAALGGTVHKRETHYYSTIISIQFIYIGKRYPKFKDSTVYDLWLGLRFIRAGPLSLSRRACVPADSATLIYSNLTFFVSSRIKLHTIGPILLIISRPSVWCLLLEFINYQIFLKYKEKNSLLCLCFKNGCQLFC